MSSSILVLIRIMVPSFLALNVSKIVMIIVLIAIYAYVGHILNVLKLKPLL